MAKFRPTLLVSFHNRAPGVPAPPPSANAAKFLRAVRPLVHEIVDISPAYSRLDFFRRRYERRGRRVVHLTFCPPAELFLGTGIRNFAFFENAPAARDAKARVLALDAIFTPHQNFRSAAAIRESFRGAWRLPAAVVPAAVVPAARPAAPRGRELSRCVEVSALYDEHYTGIHRYAAQLLRALAQRSDLTLLKVDENGDAWTVGKLRRGRTRTEFVETDLRRWVHARLRPPRRLAKGALDGAAILYAGLRPARRIAAHEVSILYDFTTEIVPWAHHPQIAGAFNAQFRNAFSLSDRIFSISRASRNDARWLLPEILPRTATARPGPSLCVNRHASNRRRARRAALLVVSSVEPRKNMGFAFEWFLKTAALPEKFELWWVGVGLGGKSTLRQTPWLVDIAANLRDEGAARRIVLWGPVSDEKLCELYRAASFTLYPSLYEGFGFPVLDSLCHRTPVVCGYHSSLTEFRGPGVFHCDVHDGRSLDRAVRAARKFSPAKISTSKLRAAYSWEKLGLRVGDLCRP